MADAGGRKDVRLGAVSKAALEQGQMDLSGLRMGKQRLVSRKKKKSSLKKVILEEREERRQQGEGTEGAAPPPRASPAVALLSLDAPEFVPAAWATQAPREAAAEPPAEGQAAEAAEGGAVPFLPSSTPLPMQVPTPVFVPSWCRTVPEEREPSPAAERSAASDAELPVAEAIERMRMMRDGSCRQQDRKGKPENRQADIEVRHYVHQVLSDELDEKVKVMLGELVRFQERAKERDPLKYAKLKRFCVGMREARRSVARGKAKCIILAPNLEISTAEGGLDETVEDLIEASRENEVPVIFALSRNRIGKALGKNIRLSIVAVLSAEGVHQEFKQVLKLTDDLRRQWVLRQMSQVTDEDAEEARKRAAEKVIRDAERRAERERREVERKEEEERRRAEAKAAKEAEKARKAAERQAQIEKRRAEKAAKLAEEQAAEPARKAEEERRLAAEQAAREEERERARKEAELRAEEERKRLLAQQEAAAARAAAEGDGSDSDSSEDLPAGFQSALF